MDKVILERDVAKHRLAVNLWARIEARAKRDDLRGYKWLADEMTRRLGETVHVSRIQKILEQTTSPDWSFLVTMAGVFGCAVEDFGREPTDRAEKRYAERFPKFARKMSLSA